MKHDPHLLELGERVTRSGLWTYPRGSAVLLPDGSRKRLRSDADRAEARAARYAPDLSDAATRVLGVGVLVRHQSGAVVGGAWARALDEQQDDPERLAASFEAAGSYRWELRRRLGQGDGVQMWIMLNPSTADEHLDDPTIRRVLGFARDAGRAEVRVLNLFPLRATDPRALWAAEEEVRQPDLARTLRLVAEHARASREVVLGWGAHGEGAPEVVEAVLAVLAALGVPLRAVGLTKGGQPRHPLYAPRAPLRRLTIEGLELVLGPTPQGAQAPFFTRRTDEKGI